MRWHQFSIFVLGHICSCSWLTAEVFLIYVSNSDSLMEGLMFCIKRRAFNSSCKLVGEDQRYPPEEPVVLLTREVVDIT
jgi:hypothetical protein